MMQPTTKPVPVSTHSAGGSALGTLHRDAAPIFIFEDVLEDILAFSERDLKREQGGFLLGGCYQDRGVYVEVRNFLPAKDARSRPASFTFTHDTWSSMTREVDQRFPDDQVVGWHHTHPDLGVFLSGYDLFIQRHFFNAPWQIAMVVDPCRGEFCFFQWRGDRIADCGFVCVPRSQ